MTKGKKDIIVHSVVPAVTTMMKSYVSGQKEDAVQAISNIIQRAGRDGLFQAFKDEWEEMAKKSRITPDFEGTDIGQASLQELFAFLAEERPEKARFDAMKTLFFKAANVDADEASKTRCLQLMKVCRGLDATELLILSVVYQENCRRHQNNATQRNISSDAWPGMVESASKGSLSSGLVEHYEDRLVEKRLIGERQHPDRSGIRHEQEFRLTHLGLELGSFLHVPDEENR